MRNKIPDNIKFLMKRALIQQMGEDIRENEGIDVLNDKFDSIVEFADRYMASLDEILQSNEKYKKIAKEIPRKKHSNIVPGITLTNEKRWIKL